MTISSMKSDLALLGQIAESQADSLARRLCVYDPGRYVVDNAFVRRVFRLCEPCGYSYKSFDPVGHFLCVLRDYGRVCGRSNLSACWKGNRLAHLLANPVYYGNSNAFVEISPCSGIHMQYLYRPVAHWMLRSAYRIFLL